MSSPKISVIIPVYNAERYLEQCLDSVINQTFKDTEIICINDGSTDGSDTILDKYMHIDSRIKVILQKNAGPGVARNTGLAHASGEYIFFLDSDDYLLDNALSEIYEYSLQKDLDVCICKGQNYSLRTHKYTAINDCIRTKYLPQSSVFNSTDISDYIFQFCVGWPWDKLYRRSLLERYGIRFPALSNSEDTYFVYLSLLYAERISVLDKILITHRVDVVNSVSSSRTSSPDAFITSLDLIRENLIKNKRYKQFEKSFVNYFISFSYWHMSTIPSSSKEYLYKKVRAYLHKLNYIYGTENSALYYAYMAQEHWEDVNNFIRLKFSLYDNLWQRIFSLKRLKDKSHYVCTILGIKIKIRRANV